MGTVRELSPQDLPQVAALHARTFPTDGGGAAPSARQRHFEALYFRHPWPDPDIRALVYEEHGRIDGFLGMVPRRCRLDGRIYRAAVTSDFCVDSQRRGLAGVLLVKRLLSGPQDLTYSDEANDSARGLWERLGAGTVFLPSVRWTRPLRPAALAQSSLAKRSPAAGVLRPVVCAADACLSHWMSRPGSGLRSAPLDAESLLEYQQSLAGKVRFENSLESARWLLQRAGEIHTPGTLQASRLWNPDGAPAGCYAWYLRPGSLCDLVLFWAASRQAEAVARQLAWEVRERGGAALTGRLEPPLLPIVLNWLCLVQPGPRWMLLHTRHPEIRTAFHEGAASIPRLEGEWCHHLP